MERYRFISDLHIPPGEGGRQAEALGALERFLDDCLAAGVTRLYVLGDLFAYWYETASHTASGFEPPLALLRGYSGRGLRVSVLPGNRDFLLGPRFRDATGCGVSEEEVRLELGGVRATLLHGDRLTSRDRRYQRWRKFSRGAFFRRMLAGLPERAMRLLAYAAMRGSAVEKSMKSRRTMMLAQTGLMDLFARGADAVIVGHVHEPGEATLDLPGGRKGRVIVLGEWADGLAGAWAEWSGGELVLHYPNNAQPAVQRDSC